MAKRLDGKKVATGILAAVALYYLGGLISGFFSDDGGTSADTNTDGPEVAALGVDDSNFTPPPPMPEQTVTAPPPAPAPAQTPAAPVAAPTENLLAKTQAAPPPDAGSLALEKPSEGGIINKSQSWFKNLSPAAQAALAQGVVGGAAGLMQGLAQKSAQEDAKRIEDQKREDKTRRGSIQAFSLNSFRPKGA